MRQDDGVRRNIQPESIAPPAVLVESPSRWLHTSGVVPVAVDGSTPDDIAEQAAVVWANIAAMLDDADMEAGDIVSVTTYAVVGVELGQLMAARDSFLGAHRAASTLVTVPALARAEWRMEVAVVAAR